MTEPQLEDFLRSLPAAPPSGKLLARVEDELESDAQWLPAPRRQLAPRWIGPLAWSALGAAAAVAVMFAISDPGVSPPAVAAAPPVSAVLPVTTVREVVDARDEGIRYNAQSRLPEQHVKYVTVERHAWIDPRDGAQITVELPREDNLVLPVSFQ